MLPRTRRMLGGLIVVAAAALAFAASRGSHESAAPLGTETTGGDASRDLAAAPRLLPSAAAPAAPKPAATNALRGEVLGIDGAPAAGASVAAFRLKDALDADAPEAAPRWSAATDDRGRFAFENVPDGAYGLTARAAAGIATLPSVRVAASGDTTVTLRFVAAVAIEGRVVDENDAPIPGARVVVDASAPLRAMYQDLYREMLRTRQEVVATSDERGAFRLGPLEAGTYGIAASAPGRIPRSGVPSRAPASGVAIVLRPGGGIRGVVSIAGTPAPPVVRVADLPSDGREFAATGGEASFAFEGVEPGRHRVRALAVGFGMAETVVEVRAGAAGDPIRFSLSMGTPVTGLVRETEGDVPIPDAEVTLAFVSDHRGGSWSSRLEQTLHTDGRGAWSARLRPGEWVITAKKSGYASPESDGPIPLFEVGAEPLEHRIRLVATATIEGEVVYADGGPVEGADVGISKAGLNPASKETGPIGDGDVDSVTTDAVGHFRIEGVARYGQYDVTATGPGGATATASDVVFASGSRVATIRLAIQLVAETGGRVEGRVVDEGGGPIAGAVVAFAGRSVTTAADGTFARDLVSVGAHRARLAALGFATAAPPPFSVAATETTKLPTWTLKRHGVVVGGTVTAPDGKPIEGAYVTVWFPLDEDAYVRATTTSRDGTYRLEGPSLAEGELVVQASSAERRNVDRRVPVAPESTVDIVLAGSATATATVSFSGPSPKRLVVQENGEGDFLMDVEAELDATGVLKLTYVPVGHRRFRITAEGYAPTLLPEREFVEGATVSLGAIRMTPGGTLSGRILDADGKPLAGVQVALEDIVFLQVDTDADGRFRLEHAPAGTWQASINAIPGREGPSPTFTVTIEEGKVAEIERKIPR